MPLTKAERVFLDAYVHEATHEPFGGPATDDLRRRGIRYDDLHGFLTAYHRETTQEGLLPFGEVNRTPPPSPWRHRQEAIDRGQALLREHMPTPEHAEDSTDNRSVPSNYQHAAAPVVRRG